ncbi:MAG: VOC family protein [Alphaproteobacteria bacterium]|nr:VOC family protein [Alphaproteobacteria bacterium]
MPDPDRKHEDLSDDERLHHFRVARDAIDGRLAVLEALRDGPEPLAPREFHASVRVPDLAAAARFYAWLLGVEPKEWTHRYVTFVSAALRTNFVVLVSDGKTLHHDTLYHLGIEVPDRAAVIDAHRRAVAAGWPVHKPARTTWRGTPLHELWLTDPGGNLVEVYARLTPAERAAMPADQEPVFLV